MKKSISLVFVIAALAAAFLLTNPQRVSADPFGPPSPSPLPAAGSWSWDDETVTGTIIPQYQLAPTYEADFALLQSEGIHLSGPTQLCHPYPGGQFGWNAEIRVLTNTGWQQVPTVNEWVPDEEGKFMTCAQVNYSGTYAIFGYWEKYAGWERCPVPGFSTFILSFRGEVAYYSYDDLEYAHTGCDGNGGVISDPPMGSATLAFWKANYYCCNDTIYTTDSIFGEPLQ